MCFIVIFALDDSIALIVYNIDVLLAGERACTLLVPVSRPFDPTASGKRTSTGESIRNNSR